MLLSVHDPVHFTNLKRMSDSPAHYLASLEQPGDKTAFLIGRLTHFLVLGGDYEYAVFEGKTRAGKVWEAFEAANCGRDIFKMAEVEQAQRIADVVKADPVAAPYLVGEHELEVEWEFLGRKCSSRIDALNDYVVDLKTTTCAKPTTFRYDVDRYAYAAQLAFYREAARVGLGRATQGGVIVAVEKELPHAVTVCRLSPALLEDGMKLCRLWMERLLLCEARNEWPSYVQHVVDYDVRPTLEVPSLMLTMHNGQEVAA